MQSKGGATVICYHGLPMSGPQLAAAKILANRDAMVSFWEPSQMEIAAEVCRSVVLDCGAFSAWKAGTPITDWSDYYAFCDQWRKHPAVHWAIVPDVIDGSEEQNDELLDEWPHGGFGMPVWHLHESLDRLWRLAHGWGRVALGSSGQYAAIGTPQWWQRMGEAMSVLCDDQGRPLVPFHGLRMLDPTLLAHFPFRSADSTNVARNIGLDVRWSHPYAPRSLPVRAAVIMDRIENHAKCSRWIGTHGEQLNFELLDCYGVSA